LVAEEEASRSEVRHLMSRFFGNSREQLLLSLLGDEEISPKELERLKETIRNAAADEDTHIDAQLDANVGANGNAGGGRGGR
jgi:hypothetical protein